MMLKDEYIPPRNRLLDLAWRWLAGSLWLLSAFIREPHHFFIALGSIMALMVLSVAIRPEMAEYFLVQASAAEFTGIYWFALMAAIVVTALAQRVVCKSRRLISFGDRSAARVSSIV